MAGSRSSPAPAADWAAPTRCCSRAEGAAVVVNDRGRRMTVPGTGRGLSPPSPSQRSRRSEARLSLNSDDIADCDAAKHLIDSTIEAFGDVDILVNNAGILRDRLMVNMTEGEWDEVISVHLRGHFCPTRHAAAYWREEHKAGRGGRATS